MSDKYILYARKSTDVEDKQVLSIEAQLAELRTYAKNEGLQIIDELVEKKSAKTPGRPIFGSMLKRIEAGEASGIVAWHPDRLARNSIDGGQIVYLLDQTHLQSLKFPTFWFENTSQGKFMLSIAFGQSKYSVDNLSENTKRGLRQKVRRGEFPGLAPVGYINDIRTKTVVIDKRYAPIVLQGFELYAKGNKRLVDIVDYFAANGVVSKTGKHISKDKVKYIFNNPIYYGHFYYMGEVHEGNHTPIVSKKLFDEVQAVLTRRGRPRKSKVRDIQPFCGVLRCAMCQMMITSETHEKHQKNGNIHHYTYYRCTKKSKMVKCTEPAVRSELLDAQLSAMLQEYAMPVELADSVRLLIAKDEANGNQLRQMQTTDLHTKTAHITAKLQRLLDSYLDQDIDRPDYVAKKAELMSQKKTLDEKMSGLTLGHNTWVEPMKKWLETAVSICKIANGGDLEAKKLLCGEIFGLNLFLENRKVGINADQFLSSPQKNKWVLLRKTALKLTKKGATRPISDFNLILEPRSGLEPETPSLPWKCSTTELSRQKL